MSIINMRENAIYITPINSELVNNNSISLTNIIALYIVNGSDAINVGKPSLTSYLPAMANMYGYNDAIKKGYFLQIPVNQLNNFFDVPVFKVYVTNVQTVDTSLSKCINSEDCYIENALEEDTMSITYSMAK